MQEICSFVLLSKNRFVTCFELKLNRFIDDIE